MVVGKKAKYDDRNRYTPDENASTGASTIEDALQQAEKENQLLNAAATNSINKDMKSMLEERFNGFKVATPQEELLSVTQQRFTPDNNTDPTQQFVFALELNEHVIPSDFNLEFKVSLYKSINGTNKTRFPINADVNHVDNTSPLKIAPVENFIFHYIKSMKVFTNYALESDICSNNFTTGRNNNNFKAFLQKKMYKKTFKDEYLNAQMGMCDVCSGDPNVDHLPTVDQSLAATAINPSLPANNANTPRYQTFLKDK